MSEFLDQIGDRFFRGGGLDGGPRLHADPLGPGFPLRGHLRGALALWRGEIVLLGAIRPDVVEVPAARIPSKTSRLNEASGKCE